jgi:outer membrane protein assembly factor BamB
VADGGGDAGEASVAANTLISDQFNNRVIEVTTSGQIVWTFGDGTAVPGPTSVVAPNDSERLPNGQTLISGTGAPAGADPACTSDAGCADNRVLLVGADGGIVWSYGGDGGLSAPVCAMMLPDGHILITDQGNNRIVELDPTTSTVVWTYAPTSGAGALSSPNSAQRLTNGNTLIADENNNRVIEVNADGGMVWEYTTTPDAGPLGQVAFVSRLPTSNDTLISDSTNNRILEVNDAGAVVWAYNTASRTLTANPAAAPIDGGNPSPTPTRALRLASGNTLISDQFNHQVIEVDPQGHIVWTYGALNDAGAARGQLNAPYDAKRIGDYTGLPLPPAH